MNTFKKIYLLVIACAASIFPLHAQAILNGDFENHSANTCAFNLENEEFNEMVENVYAFGSNSEMDIQTSGCGFADLISNDWFVSLSQRPTGPYDQIALALDMPLTEGTTYQLSYYDWADTTSNPQSANVPLPLQIGLSTDSTNFGEMIYSSLPEGHEWTWRTTEFTAPNNGRFITLRIYGANGLKGWTSVDNFVLTPPTHVVETYPFEAKVFPNPALDWIYVETKEAMKYIRVFNAIGQQLLSSDTLPFFNQINLAGLSAGVYFLEIGHEHGRVVKRVEKI